MRDDYFPYSQEPMPTKRFPYRDPRLSRAPYAANTATADVPMEMGGPPGMTGGSAPSVMLPPSGQVEGPAMPVQSSEFVGWEAGGDVMGMLQEMMRSSLMDKMNGVTREYY